MSTHKIKGCVAYTCDGPGCHEGLETGERKYAEARAEARREGWIARKDHNDEWQDFCSRACEEAAR